MTVIDKRYSHVEVEAEGCDTAYCSAGWRIEVGGKERMTPQERVAVKNE